MRSVSDCRHVLASLSTSPPFLYRCRLCSRLHPVPRDGWKILQWEESSGLRHIRVWYFIFPLLHSTFPPPSRFLFLPLIPDSSPHLYHHVNFHLIFRCWNWDLYPGPRSPTPHRALFLEGSSACAGSVCLQHVCLRCSDEAAATKRKKNKVIQDRHHLSCFIVVQSTVLFLRWILAC